MSKRAVRVCIGNGGRSYFFDLNGIDVSNKSEVIVSTDKCDLFGVVVGTPIDIENDNPLFFDGKILRLASKNDSTKNKKNIDDSKKTMKKAQELANSLELGMKIIDANYTFDRSQLIITFTADDRVDFRELAKKLAAIYKTITIF